MAHHQGNCFCEVSSIEQVPEGMRYVMNKHIDIDKVVVLNESVNGSGVKIFKDWEDRLDRSTYVESDVDEELLFNIPFRGNVKITGVILAGDLDSTHPASMKIFKDRPSMSFEDTSCKAEQEFSIKQDPYGHIDYALKATKFSSLTHLSIYFPTNFGAVNTRIYYIGLRGQYLSNIRQQIAITMYEARPMVKEHKNEFPDVVGRGVF